MFTFQSLPIKSTLLMAAISIAFVSLKSVALDVTSSCPLPSVFDEMPSQEIKITSLDSNNVSKIKNFRVLVAETAATRSAGFQHVCELQATTPILFVFSNEVDVNFHMRNVNIALKIFFFNSNGLLVDSFLMTPYLAGENTLYSPRSKVQYALEIPLALLESYYDLQNIKQIERY